MPGGSTAHGADFCSELPQRPYDPDKAKFHFKKSGYSSAELHVAPVAVGIEEMCLRAQVNCAKKAQAAKQCLQGVACLLL